METDVFEFKINGDNVLPETVDLDDLVQVLADLREAVVATAVSLNPQPLVSLFLVDIERGSNKLSLKASDDALHSTRTIIEALRTGNFSRVPPKAQKHLRRIWQVTRDNRWENCQFLPNGADVGDATIESEVELFPNERVYKGLTTIYGRCTRAGGEQSYYSAKLTLLDGTKKTVELASREMAENLGHRLYQVVGLEGEATWTVSDDELVAFKTCAISPYADRSDSGETRTVVESFRDLATSAAGRWDSVDPEEFVSEQRRD